MDQDEKKSYLGCEDDSTCYPRYFALWHLQRIKMFKSKPKEPPTTQSEEKSEDDVKNLVALIDNGVDIDHPYLEGRVAKNLAIDFASCATGLLYGAGNTTAKLPIKNDILGQLDLTDEFKALLAPFVAQLSSAHSSQIDRTTLQRLFPAHGTACAGLIAGHTPLSKVPKDPEKPCCAPVLLPYLGVDPNCEIVPINTSLDPTPQQLIAALLYALASNVDVICFPRGVGDLWLSAEDDTDNPGGTLRRERATDQWRAFEALFVSVAKIIPIVCAAGNSGESTLAYPASLSVENGSDNGVISVGASTYCGYRAGYSNYGPGLTLVAPSDDEEVLNHHQVRLDERSRRYRFHEYAGFASVKGTEKIPFSHQGVLAIDIPGNAGYFTGNSGMNGSDADNIRNWTDPTRGMFTLFGGTSAASAIVAGVASQVIRKAKQKNPGKARPLSGIDVKNILAGSCDPGDRAGERLFADNINGEKPNRKALFGAGLIDLEAALNQVP